MSVPGCPTYLDVDAAVYLLNSVIAMRSQLTAHEYDFAYVRKGVAECLAWGTPLITLLEFTDFVNLCKGFVLEHKEDPRTSDLSLVSELYLSPPAKGIDHISVTRNLMLQRYRSMFEMVCRAYSLTFEIPEVSGVAI